MIPTLRPGIPTGQGGDLPDGSAGQLLLNDGADWKAASADSAINFVIDGGGRKPANGIKGDIIVENDATITSVSLFADVAGSAQLDILRADYASYPTFTSITASAKPTLVTAQKSKDETLAGWTKTVSAGDVLRFSLESAANITRLTVCLKVRRR